MSRSSRVPGFGWLVLAGVIVLVVAGVVLDHLFVLDQTLLFAAFHGSGIVGLCVAAYMVYTKIGGLWLRALFAVLVLLIWRISYFPIMVLAGFVASLGEALAHALGWYQAYPMFLLAVAAMNFAAVLGAGGLFLLLFRRYTVCPPSPKFFHGVYASLAAPLALIALAVSFSHPSDWHALPDTTYIDRQPLPAPSLPEINPYWTALEREDISWQQRVLFRAAAITYDYVPDNTRWSQVVKGTLERDFVTTKEVTTALCTKIHYRAFMTAHPYLRDQDRFQRLRERE